MNASTKISDIEAHRDIRGGYRQYFGISRNEPPSGELYRPWDSDWLTRSSIQDVIHDPAALWRDYIGSTLNGQRPTRMLQEESAQRRLSSMAALSEAASGLLQQASTVHNGDLISQEGDSTMDEQLSRRVDRLERDIGELRSAFAQAEGRISKEIERSLLEFRRADDQRHLEVIELRKEMVSSVKEVHGEVHRLEGKIEENRKWWVSLMVTAVIGIAAIVVTILVS